MKVAKKCIQFYIFVENLSLSRGISLYVIIVSVKSFINRFFDNNLKELEEKIQLPPCAMHFAFRNHHVYLVCSSGEIEI